MKYLDFSSLFNGDPAYIAFFSTYQFDPDFFEKRLLRCPTLTKARRIVVFLDARQWFDLMRRDVPAHWLNRRYLVVPIHRRQGVFHPKLNLVLNEKGGQVQCGSNNLTRSGCSSNLELLNAIPFLLEAGYEEEISLAKEAFAFFRRATQDTDEEIARIVGEWIDETGKTFSWLNEPEEEQPERGIRLVHTYEGSIWDRLVERFQDSRPKELFVISPFHDADAEMCRRLGKQWPRCKVELLVQQGYTNLAVEPLKSLSGVQLSELRDCSRRIHAKLLGWRSSGESGCLVGSANFTVAAFDGRNVEACLLLNGADELIDSLFDKELAKRPLKIGEFEPGTAEEPETDKEQSPALTISSAVLLDADHLRVSYAHRLNERPTALRLAIRTPGEIRPRKSIRLPNRAEATETVVLPENSPADSHGTVLATLVAEVSNHRRESLPVWVIQEGRLTYEPGEGSSSTKSKIEESGEGLPEYLDEIGKRDGISAVVDYLRHLNIRFHDGGGRLSGQRKFRLRIRDPFHADTAPEWLIEAKATSDDLEGAIYEFVDRHEKQRLRRHASRGNINGMENFLDIFTTMIRLLYVYYRRGVVKRGQLIGRLCDYLELATSGKDSETDPSDGFLFSLYDSLAGDVGLLQEVCDETNFPAEVRAALLIVQNVRYVPDEQPMYGPAPKRPRDVLQSWADTVRDALFEVDVEEPSVSNVRKSLEAYRMLSEEEVSELLAEL